jgi:beta-galactosidase/beta-glucuronidase
VHTNSSTHSLGGSNGTSGSAFTFTVPNPSLWSPDSPTLYNVTITMGSDVVEVYTGFRTVSRGTVGNVTRPLLNGKFIFAFGPLE